ncbi:MAG: IS21 family transposase [Actinobacteria bacterium]|nr:IS21 family transposase [Actinomycetota bacterium]
MRKITDVLRLNEAGFSQRQIAESLGCARSTVGDTLSRAHATALTYEAAQELDEAELYARLYPGNTGSSRRRAEPDYEYLHRELRRDGVTLQLLWVEYREDHPRDGLQYSQFCRHYRTWEGTIDVVMRQHHRAGEKAFVDFAGQTQAVVNPATGEVREVPVFCGCLGASSYTYAEALPSADLAAFLAAHVRMFAYFAGVPRVIVPDNLKDAVKLASFYEPDLNPSYLDLARHYGCAILPTRVARPRDKAKVESAVQVVERQVLAPLRNRTFFSLAEVNAAFHLKLTALNAQSFQKMEGSRQSLFETLDRPALSPLPRTPYEFALWKRARVNIDYHVQVDGSFYSVPHQLARREVEVRLSARVVEVFHAGHRVASHARSLTRGAYVTAPEHMPASHRAHLEWTPSRLIGWGASVGPSTGALIAGILERRPHPEQGYRACLGLMRLGREYTPDRLEAAAARALAIKAFSFRSVKNILARGLDRVVLSSEPEPGVVPLFHEHVRGPEYFAEEVR